MIIQRLLEVRTEGRGFVNITGQVEAVVSSARLSAGMCTVFVRHTSASLIIQENADPAVLRDLQRWFDELAPEKRNWEHADEGPDDMPAHARSALTRTSESIPICEGRLALGTWQGLYLWEHRRRPHLRSVLVHISGRA